MNTNPERQCSLVHVPDTLSRTVEFKGAAGLTVVIRVYWCSFAVAIFYPVDQGFGGRLLNEINRPARTQA